MPPPDLIVIGASSGGVEALQYLCRRLPADLPASVVLVLHTGRQKRSFLPGILSRVAAMPVLHVEDGEPLRHGHIYVAPPDYHVLVEPGLLRLSRSATEHYTRPAIDPTFRTAARAYGERVIGVVLTGNLGDGAAGLLTIQRYGGVTVVQDPEDAQHPQMPENAIDNVEVDYIMPLSEIAECLVKLVTAKEGTEEKKAPMQWDEGSPEQLDVNEAAQSMVEREQSAQILNERQGMPAIFTCPECGGTLWQAEEKLVHFRCHVGHAYAGGDLLDHQANATEGRLWEVLRYLVDQSVLGKQLGAKAARDGRTRSALHFEHRAEVAEQHAAVIRRLIEDTTFTDAEDPRPLNGDKALTGGMDGALL